MRVISKKRLVTTTLGIVISIAIIFSMFTVGNNATKFQVYEQIKGMPYTFAIGGNLPASNYTKVLSAIKNMSHVEWAEGYIYRAFFYNNSEHGSEKSIMSAYFADMNTELNIVSGKLPFYKYDIAISYSYAKTHNISVNSILNIYKYSYNGTYSIVPFHVVGIYYEKKAVFQPEAVTTLSTLEYFGNCSGFFAVKVNTNYLLSSLDMNKVNQKVWNIKIEATSVFYRYGGETENPGYNSVMTSETMENENPILFIIYLVYALPIIVMGAYLSKVGIEIELTERRREFGMLKVRGVSKYQQLTLLFYEFLVYSVIGGIVGYLLGELMAYIGNVFFYHLPFFYLDYSVEYGLSAILLSASLFAVAFYKPWKKINSASIVDLINHYSLKFNRVEYSPLRDLIKVIFFWAYLVGGLYLVQNFSLNGGLSLLVIIAVVIEGTFMLFLPLILMFLPLYMARLLTLGTQKLYYRFVEFVAIFLKVSKGLVKKGVERNPKHMAYVAFILAFILTFSTLVTLSEDNQVMINKLHSAQVVGGDFKVDINQYGSTLYLLGPILNSKNQSAHVWVASGSGVIEGNNIALYFANFKNYTNSVYDLKHFIYAGGFKGDRVVVTKSFAMHFNVHVGDIISISLNNNGYASGGVSHSHGIHQYQVSGIVYSIPGVCYSTDAVFIDAHVEPQNATSLIIKARNYSAIKTALDMSGIDYQERYGKTNTQSTLFFSTVELFLVILGGATLFIVYYSLYYNRRGEFSLYMVRGARRGQIRRILLTEGGAVILISLLIGVSIGMAISYVLVSFQISTIGLPSFFVVGSNFIEGTFSMLFVFFLVQYSLAVLFSRVHPGDVIRANGGDM